MNCVWWPDSGKCEEITRNLPTVKFARALGKGGGRDQSAIKRGFVCSVKKQEMEEEGVGM